jgi:hypothetical protein
MMRSILAIVGGYISMSVGIILVSLLFGRLFPGFVFANGQASPKYIIVNLAYSAVFAMLGGYISGLIAGKEPVKHALILAALCSLFFLMSLGAPMPKEGGPVEPVWYKISLLVLLTPSVAAGGLLRFRQLRSRAA